MTIKSRRSFLFGAAATLVAAPAIVRVAANLMPVSTRAIWEAEWIRIRRMMWAESQINPPFLVMGELINEPASIVPGMITYIGGSLGTPLSFRPAVKIIRPRLLPTSERKP